MKKQNIKIVVTVRSKSKKAAKEKLIGLMNRATIHLDELDEFPEWGFIDDYKGEKVKK